MDSSKGKDKKPEKGYAKPAWSTPSGSQISPTAVTFRTRSRHHRTKVRRDAVFCDASAKVQAKVLA